MFKSYVEAAITGIHHVDVTIVRIAEMVAVVQVVSRGTDVVQHRLDGRNFNLLLSNNRGDVKHYNDRRREKFEHLDWMN